VRLKARLKRLAADVHWLKFDGALNVVEKQMRLLKVMRAVEAARQRQAEAVKRAVQKPPRPHPKPAPPHPEERVARLEGSEPAPSFEPTLRDAPLQGAPQGEDVRPPPAPPLPEPFVPNVPEHMLVRPVQWRIRGPDDYDWEEPGTNGRCLTEYDPLAGEYDDED
jgi:hypothetical protein